MAFAAPSYSVQVFAFNGTDYGIGAMLADFKHPKNLGYSDTANDIPECFFTIDQDDPQLPQVASYEGKAHVRILRDGDVVWAGWFGLEHDADERDIIFTGYGYLAGLYWLASDWNVGFTAQSIQTIVNAAWTRGKTTIPNSPLKFVTTGTIEAPVTTSGGSTAIELPQYTVFYKRLLFIMKEMAALSISDTTNKVLFEITHSATPTFNFWKNRGVNRPNVIWEYGDGFISGFRDYQMPVYRRNDLLAVGSAPQNSVLRYEWTAAGDVAAYGTRQEPVWFQWVRDTTELQRATGLRGALAQRTNVDLTVKFTPNSVAPPYSSLAGFAMTDTAQVRIARGATQINAPFLVAGYKVLLLDGNENLRVMLQQPSGT
jgi:hypothetical protein